MALCTILPQDYGHPSLTKVSSTNRTNFMLICLSLVTESSNVIWFEWTDEKMTAPMAAKDKKNGSQSKQSWDKRILVIENIT